MMRRVAIWGFPKIRGTLFGVLIIRILLFKLLYLGPLFSENPHFAVVLETRLLGNAACRNLRA